MQMDDAPGTKQGCLLVHFKYVLGELNETRMSAHEPQICTIQMDDVPRVKQGCQWRKHNKQGY
jgi:hypothetical protein